MKAAWYEQQGPAREVLRVGEMPDPPPGSGEERTMLEQGLLAMVGKAERGPMAIDAIRDHKSAYLMAVGGAAYLVARAIKGSKVVGFEDLGMEAIYEFEVEDMPVTVAVDSEGQSVHHLAPLVWRDKIAKKALETA